MFPKATTPSGEQQKQIEYLKFKIREVFNIVRKKEGDVHQE
jgi:hypothetical protein